MALTFAGVATLAAVGGAWAVRLNQYGRIAASVLLAAFAVTLLSRHAADWLARPFLRLGNRLSQPATTGASQGQPLNSLLLGVATGQDLPAAESGEIKATGVQAAADEAQIQSPETYIGYERSTNFSSPTGIARDQPKSYAEPSKLELNQWALAGHWTIHNEDGVLNQAPGSITFRFYARDLHLVMGPGADGKPIHFRVRLDGAPPDQNHGVDVDIQGNGVVHEQRLYQLIRQSRDVTEHTFSIEFLDQGVQAYSFTFG
jgi:hypothetical protein